MQYATVLEAYSPTGQGAMSQCGAQVSAGPGKAVISCPASVWALYLLRDILNHSCSLT